MKNRYRLDVSDLRRKSSNTNCRQWFVRFGKSGSLETITLDRVVPSETNRCDVKPNTASSVTLPLSMSPFTSTPSITETSRQRRTCTPRKNRKFDNCFDVDTTKQEHVVAWFPPPREMKRETCVGFKMVTIADIFQLSRPSGLGQQLRGLLSNESLMQDNASVRGPRRINQEVHVCTRLQLSCEEPVELFTVDRGSGTCPSTVTSVYEVDDSSSTSRR